MTPDLQQLRRDVTHVYRGAEKTCCCGCAGTHYRTPEAAAHTGRGTADAVEVAKIADFVFNAPDMEMKDFAAVVVRDGVQYIAYLRD